MTAPSRTISDRSTAQLGGRTSILARQRADHARLAELMTRARDTEAAAGTAHAVALRALARLVFTHAFAEESVLFPASRRVLPEGDPLTLRIETDHQLVNELVSELDRSSAADPRHAELLRRTLDVLDHDVRTEEDERLDRPRPGTRPPPALRRPHPRAWPRSSGPGRPCARRAGRRCGAPSRAAGGRRAAHQPVTGARCT